MNLWDRIARWRELARELALPVEGIPEHVRLREARRVSLCAGELEADLRELQQRIKQAFPAMSDDICKMILGEKEP